MSTHAELPGLIEQVRGIAHVWHENQVAGDILCAAADALAALSAEPMDEKMQPIIETLESQWPIAAVFVRAQSRALAAMKAEWEHECSDGDRICAALGMGEDARTDGGSLHLPRILARIAELAAAQAPAEPSKEA